MSTAVAPDSDKAPIFGAELPLHDPQGWDSYWTHAQERSRRAYSVIASVYRRLAIRTNLNRVVRRHFAPGSRLLHAGCGSGQVDIHLTREMRVTAIDISLPALHAYRGNNPTAEAICHGDILRLNEAVGEMPPYDGAYNLGVVEHFTHDEIVRILQQMGAMLKPQGKVVLFWPHRKATSVFVIRMLHRLLDLFRGPGQVRFHPAEISLLESRHQARQLLDRAGFELVDYEFGLRDLLVQAVVVGRKR